MVSGVILRQLLALLHLLPFVVICYPYVFEVLIDNFHRVRFTQGPCVVKSPLCGVEIHMICRSSLINLCNCLGTIRRGLRTCPILILTARLARFGMNFVLLSG